MRGRDWTISLSGWLMKMESRTSCVIDIYNNSKRVKAGMYTSQSTYIIPK